MHQHHRSPSLSVPFRPPIRHRVALLLVALLLLAQVPAAAASSSSMSLVDQQVRRLAPEHNLLVAEFDGNRCETIHAVEPNSQLAIASTFKLYVLGELARQVQSGVVGWDDAVTLRADLRSMPSGDYAWAPTGSQVPVRDLAAAMMAQSDNTATDHLIALLDRENVERAFGAFGHAEPERNVPLLLTRELFLIKMWQSGTWMDQYMASSSAERLAMLQRDVSARVIDPNGGWGNWNGPTAIDGIEWFASASDLCRVAVSLWTLGSYPGMEPVREILAGNSGNVAEGGTWRAVGYKGGYEAGVVNATWVMERRDGRVFFVSAGLNHPTGVVDAGSVRATLEPVFGCLARLREAADCA